MDFEEQFRLYGLKNIKDVDSSILVDLKYATSDNFTGLNLYGPLKNAYLLAEIAERLASVQKRLHEEHPDFNLLVYDAARPMSIQRRMFLKVRGTAGEMYVADPSAGGGYHNYGLAVDLTIAGPDGIPLDMGSQFDCFDKMSHVGDENALIESGLMTPLAKTNRQMLAKYMTEAGFDQNPTEWWHFQCYSRQTMIDNFRLLDF